MQLRHIRPRSVEWYDAMMVEELEAGSRLGLERELGLPSLIALEGGGRGVAVRLTPPVRKARRLTRAA